ncbi:MAG: ABC transporter family substrate-binding protein, partial [Actinobacteria bacterium]|nr:ABC transporter family substrate-binding protein [Actinomycetota bacterium]
DTGNGGDGGGEATGTETGDTTAPSAVSIGWNQTFYEYNSDSATGNATANNNVLYFMKSGFNYYDGDLNLVQDESFGTYEKTSDDPLTVTYTINEGVNWSDGTPVTAADVLLAWGALSGNFNTVEAEVDPETGEVTNQEAVDEGVYFNFTSDSVGLIEEFPEISEDGKSITVVYSKPFGDWEVNLGIGVPAHVVAMHALEMDDAAEATQALVDAFENNDAEALRPISQFWNTGFAFGDTLPEDESLYLSNGPYLMVDYVKDQYVTLEKNPDYTGDMVPSIDQVTFRYNEDPMAMVQALANGEVNLISPQSTADVLAAVEGLGEGFDFVTAEEATYEHVDLAVANGGPFDPATYGGDAEKAKLVRQAFLHLIPRNEIVEKLIVPLNPNAIVRNSYTAITGSPMYDAIVAANGMADAYAEVDVEAATALIEQAGVETPIDVRMLFGKSNVRRQNEFTLIKDSADSSGLFNMVDASSDEWGTLLSDTSVYDAALFGWQSTSTAVTESDANFRTGG